jgi:hypothetical protein
MSQTELQLELVKAIQQNQRLLETIESQQQIIDRLTADLQLVRTVVNGSP